MFCKSVPHTFGQDYKALNYSHSIIFHPSVNKSFRCNQPCCDSLVRPAVIWFGESLDPDVLAETDKVLASCDLCLLVCMMKI